MADGPETGGKVVLFEPPARRRLHHAVAEQLRDAIFDGRFRAGEKLPPERELAQEFAVNRTSVREAIQTLERLGLVTVRQGDGATVQPLTDASLDALPAMIFHGGRIDVALMADLLEVVTPLLAEMGRLAIERLEPSDLAALHRLRDRVADPTRAREERATALRDVVVLLSDMSRNRVWQMLARRMRAFLASPPLRAARDRLGSDPGLLVPIMDTCLDELAAGRKERAIGELQRLLSLLGRALKLEVEARVEARDGALPPGDDIGGLR
jgi:GntR family transcriptional regulator, transcriptional repressor for pyruvate dehydrogenase complex